MAQAFTEFFTAIFTANRGINASRNIHERMLQNLVHLPIAFYDRNPSGRILNRVTKDQANLDDGMSWQISVTIKCILSVIATITAITVVSPLFFLVAGPVILAFYWIQGYYRSTVRELKRLESTTRSPIYSFFGETLSGVGLIRAYGKKEYRINRLGQMLNHNQKFILANMTANRWLNMRLEGLGAVVVLATSFFAVTNFKKIGPELIGFALNYAFTITANMSIVILVYSEAEKGFTSVERILEYTKLAPEYLKGTVDLRHQIWPNEGKIEYRSVTLGYKDHLPPVVKNVSFTVLPGQKVGIIGRTGSGKSSMMLSLYRMIDLREGQILIDGVDISQVELPKLRTSLAIIPQDPIVFAGTIGSNLDPFGMHSEQELSIALKRANLHDLSTHTLVTESGSNLSVGQRQLLCLARALLLKTKILVLDEATASVDPQTDKILQETIRREIGKRTLLVIAHRLHTVVDADVLLLLDNGELVGYGAPIDLYERTYDGGRRNLFRQLVEQYGDQKHALIEKMRDHAASSRG
uniref:ATP-dependent transporter ycf16 n=1 Tax=Paramoeba aestuarina TaxID=180227 RepID=A0A7S4NMG8_9EUKA